MKRSARVAAGVVGLVVVIAIVVLVVVRATDNDEDWTTIVVGPVQFEVPASWPVHDEPACFDQSTNGVYLAPPDESCPGPKGELNVGAHPHGISPEGVLGALDMAHTEEDGVEHEVTLDDLHGLRAVLDRRVDDTGTALAYFLVDEPVVIGFTFGDPADADLARRIADSARPTAD